MNEERASEREEELIQLGAIIEGKRRAREKYKLAAE